MVVVAAAPFLGAVRLSFGREWFYSSQSVEVEVVVVVVGLLEAPVLSRTALAAS
jgi:hypothetical protein